MNFQANGDSTDWIDHGLPTPHYLAHAQYSYAIAWAIAGYFGTSASKEFLLDVVARFLLVFPNATRLPYTPELREDKHIQDRKPYELKEIAERLPSLPWSHEDAKLASFVDEGIRKYNHGKKDENRMVSEDALFEATRWHLYRRAYAEGTTENITEDYVLVLLETENQILAKPKSAGDVKSKAKNMARFMQDKFVIYEVTGYKDWSKQKRNAYMREYKHKKGINMATVQEHLKKVHKNKKLKTWNKIQAIMNDLFLEDQIRMKNGKWKISAIAELADLKRQTVSEHLKEQGVI